MLHTCTRAEVEEIEAFLLRCSHTELSYLDKLAALGFSPTDAALLNDWALKLSPFEHPINNKVCQALAAPHGLSDGSKPNQLTLIEQHIASFNLSSARRYDASFVRECIGTALALERAGLEWNSYLNALSHMQIEVNDTAQRLIDQGLGYDKGFFTALAKTIYFRIDITSAIYLDKKTAILHRRAQEQNQKLENFSLNNHFDVVTGLPNRTMFRKWVADEVILPKESNGKLALIKIGLDHFDQLNTNDGDSFSEQIIQTISARLQQYINNDDLLVHWEYDSFYLLCKNKIEISDLNHAGTEINALIRQPISTNNKNIQITCSMGIALYPHDHLEIDTLVKFAHSAMNQAHQTGGNKYQFFNQELDSQLQHRNTIANELFHAIESQQFRLYYQPVIDLQSGELVSMEALVRWYHPTRGTIPPLEFISVAEDLSLITKLGHWIIEQACIDISNWRNQGISAPRVAINVSPKQLQEPDFADRLFGIMNNYAVRPENITLEITESLFLSHDDLVGRMLKTIRKQGIHLSMDDFGTGYSALSYLKHYPFDYVKIDQSFVRDIIDNTGDAAIANAIISMTHSMGIKVVAEGVETEAQCDYLSRNMCDFIQGYFVSRPMPEEHTRQFLLTNYKLPDHLRRFYKPIRTLLLVDDEPNILSALKRLFRPDGYQIIIANSGHEGLEVIRHHQVDVIVSDQRMPEMTGVEFLRQAKQICPETIRMVLSGYTELQSITDAINEGAIYKFSTKPWDDSLLREQIAQAFRQKEMSDENRTLGLKIKTTNLELAEANRHLHELLQQKNKQIGRDETSLEIARETLQLLPIPMLGIDDEGMIAYLNSAAAALFTNSHDLLGSNIDSLIPNYQAQTSRATEEVNFTINLSDSNYVVNVRTMGTMSKSRGKLITFHQENEHGRA